MYEIKPADCWRPADPRVAVNVDFVVRGGKNTINNLHHFPYKLRGHETPVQYLDVMQHEVSLDEREWIRIGQIEVEDVGHSEFDELGDILSQWPTALVDTGCYLFGFEGHQESVIARSGYLPRSTLLL